MKFLKDKSTTRLFTKISKPHFTIPTQYLCDTIRTDDKTLDGAISASKKYWREKEKLWYGKIPLEKTYLDDISNIYQSCSMFFINNHYKQDVSDNHVWDYDFHDFLENFPKLIWLSNEYMLSDRTFKNELSSHWNPRGGVINIHPGGCRQQVLHLFANDDIPSFFFNTQEYYDKWMDDLYEVNVVELIESTKWGGDVVPDHGSLIPQLITDTNLIPYGKKKWFNKVRDKYKSGWKIYIESDLEIYGGLFDFLGDFITSEKQNSNCIIKFDLSDDDSTWLMKNYNDVYRVTKSVVASFSDINIDEDGIYVKHLDVI